MGSPPPFAAGAGDAIAGAAAVGDGITGTWTSTAEAAAAGGGDWVLPDSTGDTVASVEELRMPNTVTNE
jgi:hypothetical protein